MPPSLHPIVPEASTLVATIIGPVRTSPPPGTPEAKFQAFLSLKRQATPHLPSWSRKKHAICVLCGRHVPSESRGEHNRTKHPELKAAQKPQPPLPKETPHDPSGSP